MNNADRLVIGPALVATVHKPFAVAVLTPSLTLPPGQTVVGLAVSILDRPKAMEYDATTHVAAPARKRLKNRGK